MKYYIYGLLKLNKLGSFSDRLFYIGQTMDLKTRIINHRYKTTNKIKNAIIEKYSFELQIIWECNSKEEADEREKFLIRYYGKICDKSGILANIADGEVGDKPDYTEDERLDIIRRYKESKLSLRKFCLQTKMHRFTVGRWLKLYGIDKNIDAPKRTDVVTIYYIIRDYNNGISNKDISEKYKIDRHTVSKYIGKYA